MAIKLDSTAWENAEEDQTVRSKVLEFLRDNEGLAFHARELADEVMGTNWERAHEQERIIQKKGEREFYANKEEYGFAGEEL